MDFSDALRELKNRKKVQRAGWNGKGMWLVLVPEWCPVGDYEKAATHPFVAIKGVDDILAPWVPSALDVMATDWQVIV